MIEKGSDIVNDRIVDVRTMQHNSRDIKPLPSSFRDPAGFVYSHDGIVYRKVATNYIETFTEFVQGGLYAALIGRGLLVSHEQMSDVDGVVLKPEQVPYVSYPYEWSFSQLKSAALLTLKIQNLALQYGMSLKDASSYNVQFFGSEPRFIDTLSFTKLIPERPWDAYKQFCEHFLGPLALMSRIDQSLAGLLLVHLDGIPLDITVKLLPLKARFNYSLFVHLYLHARSQAKHADIGTNRHTNGRHVKMSKPMLSALIESLTKAIQGCVVANDRSEWSDYYSVTNYSETAMNAKEELVTGWLQEHVLEGETVHDIGANTGRFSALAANVGCYVVSHDVDRIAVERHFLARTESSLAGRVLPLHLDLTNPAPAIGWGSAERDSFILRTQSGFVLALALIHHIAIGNNTPLKKISELFAMIARKLVIEFVPKEDSQVKRMLATRDDIFPDYNVPGFEASFEQHFTILAKSAVTGSERTLYLLERI